MDGAEQGVSIAAKAEIDIAYNAKFPNGINNITKRYNLMKLVEQMPWAFTFNLGINDNSWDWYLNQCMLEFAEAFDLGDMNMDDLSRELQLEVDRGFHLPEEDNLVSRTRQNLNYLATLYPGILKYYNLAINEEEDNYLLDTCLPDFADKFGISYNTNEELYGYIQEAANGERELPQKWLNNINVTINDYENGQKIITASGGSNVRELSITVVDPNGQSYDRIVEGVQLGDLYNPVINGKYHVYITATYADGSTKTETREFDILGTGNLEQVKQNLKSLGYTYADTEYEAAVNEFVYDYRDGQYWLKPTYERLVGNQTDVLLDWTNRALQGSLTKITYSNTGDGGTGDGSPGNPGGDGALSDFMKWLAENGKLDAGNWTDIVTGMWQSFDEFYEFASGNTEIIRQGKLVKAYEKAADGSRRLIKEFKITQGYRFPEYYKYFNRSTAFKANVFSKLGAAFAAAGIVAEATQDVLEEINDAEREGRSVNGYKIAGIIAADLTLGALGAAVGIIAGAVAGSFVPVPIVGTCLGALGGAVAGWIWSTVTSGAKEKLTNYLAETFNKFFS